MKNTAKIVLSTFISLLLIYLLSTQVDLGSVVEALKHVSLGVLIISFLLYVLVYTIRALRFSALLEKEIGIFDLFNIVSVHNMMTSLLPMRAGELSYVYLVNRKGEKKTFALASILITRTFDMLAIATIFLVATAVSNLEEPRLYIVDAIVLASVLGATLVFFIAYRFMSILKNAWLMRLKLYSYFISKLEEALGHMMKIRKTTLLGVYGYSLFLWGVSFFMSYLIVKDLGIDIGLSKTVSALCFTALLSTIPVQGLLGFGTIEAGWTIIFMYLGIEKSIAIASGFSFHIITIIFFVLLGVPSLLLVSKHKKV